MAIIVSAHSELPNPDSISDIYCDESSQTRHRYMVMGGLIIPSRLVAQANTRIAELRLPELPQGEMKWGSVSRGKLAAYRRIADAFFDDKTFAGVDFHTTVVDTWGQDHQRFGDGDRDKTFNKELYQLASKFARLYPDRLFHLYPDDRETIHRPGELRDILNFGRKKKGDKRDFPFRRSHFRKSCDTPLIQVVDILLGSLAYQVNGHMMVEGASEAKISLSAHILGRANVRNVMADTNMRGKFTIWHRKLQPRNGRPPA
ncbi:DUF3800 domain-containing protein [Sphingobium sp. D43FB]|uniref:DUF3800 domain-containing protein n=1 Tax=Sphingobium sp. D43FB TaxID=2017595 RepID=UPI000BB597BA|nr:DUF3800 domain-containing protein [Sphingobium sp. D43FB]PBN41308.1 hypothetical protein SxD43FB_22525 [Sphingobium sp. D43FB]